MADRKIVELPISQTLSDTDYMLVSQNGTPVWVTTDKMKENAANAVTHPTVLPNPKKLKFTGAVTAEYDGSTEQTINIPAGGTGGTSDYNALSNKPKVNNVELSGNKTLDDLGIQEKIASVVENKIQFDKEIVSPNVVATTVEADNLYSNTVIDGKLGAKLDKNQGSVNQGKFLSVGSDGNIQLVEAPSGGGGSDYTLPQATENALGGIKAKAKTDETVEVAIDSASGKLYVPTYPTPSGSSGGLSARYDSETQNIVFEENGQGSGGGSVEKEWKVIAEIDVLEETSSYEYDNLDNLTEIFIYTKGLTNIGEQDSVLRGIIYDSAGGNVECIAIDTQKSATNMPDRYQRHYIKYNGMYWESQKLSVCNNEQNYYLSYNQLQSPYSVKLAIGQCKKLYLRVAMPSSQALKSGQIYIYGR